jgi:hypothetical protein
MPVQTSFDELAVCAEKPPEGTLLIINQPSEPAISISKIWALLLDFRKINRDRLFQMDRGLFRRG